MAMIKVQICLGTACVVMGGVDPQTLAEELTAQWPGQIELSAAPCLEYCKNPANGKSPFVIIDGQMLARATREKIIEQLQKIINEKKNECH